MAATTQETAPMPRPDAATILSVASYNRSDLELPVVSLHPKQHDAVRSSLFRPFARAQTYDLGPQLGRLPFELVSLVCQELDVASAFRFSHVNRTTREVLASVREFRHLAAHALETLCVLMRTTLGSHVGVLDLYGALTTRNCELCGAFGGFFFLPTATRCCLTCVASAPEMRVSHVSRVAEAAGVSAMQLEKQRRLPVLHTLPDARKRIVAVEHAVKLLRECGEEDPEAVVARWPDSLTLRFAAATSLPYLDRRADEAQCGLSCKGCQLAFEADFSDDHLELRDRFYSRAEFMEHFDECPAAEKLWVSSREGAAPVEPQWMGLGRAFTADCGRRRPSFARSERSDN